MTPVCNPPETGETVADLLDRLGGISPERVPLHPPPGTATEADVLALLEAPRKQICELVDGVLVEKAMGFRESRLAVILIGFLHPFVTNRDLGLVIGADGAIRLWAGRVCIPDVAFFSWARFPGRRLPTEPIPTLVPDLAVEILSDSNTPQEMAQKRQDYFQAGVRLVWEIDPRKRTVQVFTAPDAVTSLSEADTLDGGDVLPGFSLRLGELFGEPD